MGIQKTFSILSEPVHLITFLLLQTFNFRFLEMNSISSMYTRGRRKMHFIFLLCEKVLTLLTNFIPYLTKILYSMSCSQLRTKVTPGVVTVGHPKPESPSPTIPSVFIHLYVGSPVLLLINVSCVLKRHFT